MKKEREELRASRDELFALCWSELSIRFVPGAEPWELDVREFFRRKASND